MGHPKGCPGLLQRGDEIMCSSAETQVMLMMTMQTINICGVIYIASKIFRFISIVAKYLLREIERNGQDSDYCKKENLEEL